MDENNIGWCIEAHDLAASKIIAFREKDRVFVRRLLLESMIDADKLMKRIQSIETEEELKEQALRWVEKIAAEL